MQSRYQAEPQTIEPPLPDDFLTQTPSTGSGQALSQREGGLATLAEGSRQQATGSRARPHPSPLPEGEGTGASPRVGKRGLGAQRRLVRAAYIGLLVLSDVAAIALAFVVAYELRAASEQRPSRISPLDEYVPMLGFLVGSLVVTFALMRLYLPRRGTAHVDQLASLLLAVTIGNVVAMALSAFSLRGLDVPRLILVYAWGLSILFVWVGRTTLEQGLRAARRGGLDAAQVLIVGAGDEGRTILHKIRSAPEMGYRALGFVATDSPHSSPLPEGGGASKAPLPVVGATEDLPEILERHNVDEVIIADSRLSHAQMLDIVASCDRARVSVRVFPDIFHLVLREVSVSEFGGLPMLRVRDVSLRGWNLLVKRVLDIVLAAVLLVVSAPLLLLVALAVKLTSAGPAFFIQERVGIDGRPFPCVKFRSMLVEAEAATGPVWAAPEDDRTTPLGKILRRYSIDELPQLVNVLVGDMSLVGPRPERPHFVEQFSRLIPRYEKRHQEKAGVTGWAQVNGLRGQTSIEERTLYDLFYVEHWSPPLDLKILLKTIGAVLRGRNAY